MSSNDGKSWLAFDHADVIGSISNGQRHSIDMKFDTVDDHSFLQRR